MRMLPQGQLDRGLAVRAAHGVYLRAGNREGQDPFNDIHLLVAQQMCMNA